MKKIHLDKLENTYCHISESCRTSQDSQSLVMTDQLLLPNTKALFAICFPKIENGPSGFMLSCSSLSGSRFDWISSLCQVDFFFRKYKLDIWIWYPLDSVNPQPASYTPEHRTLSDSTVNPGFPCWQCKWPKVKEKSVSSNFLECYPCRTCIFLMK